MPQTDSQQKTVGLILGHESSDDINDQLNWALIEWDDLEKRIMRLPTAVPKTLEASFAPRDHPKNKPLVQLSKNNPPVTYDL